MYICNSLHKLTCIYIFALPTYVELLAVERAARLLAISVIAREGCCGLYIINMYIKSLALM